MKDTHDEMDKKQLEIWLSKPLSERQKIAGDLIDFGKRLMTDAIRKQFPHFNELEVRIEFYKRAYGNEIKGIEMKKLIESTTNYYHQHKDSFVA